MIRKISQSLSENPFRIQSAIDRQWEKAWKISLADFVYTEDQIRDFVKGESPIVAIELFYQTREGTDFYFGIEYHQDLKGPQGPFEFVATYFRTISKLKNRSFQNVIYHLGKELHHDPSPFIFAEPTSVLMGVVNWWMTFGPCEIWKRGEPKRLTLSALQQKLKGHENRYE